MRVILTSREGDEKDREVLIAGSLTPRQAEVMVAWLDEDRGLPPDRCHMVVPENHKLKKEPR